MKRSRRITLIDLLLLVVMIGVLVPRLLQTDRFRDLGPVRVRVTEMRRNDGLTLAADFSFVGEASSESHDVGIAVYDTAGNVMEAAFDLAPEPGTPRELIVSVRENAASYYMISSGDRKMRIQLTVEEP